MLQVVWNVIKYIYGLFYAVLRPLRRVVCRRRKLSTSDDIALTSVATGNLRLSTPQQYGEEQDADLEMESWDAWDNPNAGSNGGSVGDAHLNGYHGKPSLGVSSIQNYHYNQHRQQQQQQQQAEPEPDFFGDMTPTVKKQTKILIRKKEEEAPSYSLSSRLAVMSDVPMVTSELEAWEEENNAWDNEEAAEDLTWQAEEALKETRRKERAQRVAQNQRRKQQKELERGRTTSGGGGGGGHIGTRVS
ncbi:receptor-binding cancer antigen expressed on SiSo cells-like protein [Elysia marginata]|uniref:Receptor-binding cancer antigen expressed on SiSo cells-like protein n=1 Tax=Elysia marginata TaxID=1093978 RepID=A0AAV4GD34_9GAST|nr:receptor-binding cancer antigen expressed on SiSo cells-like protein [Elysia marginata]